MVYLSRLMRGRGGNDTIAHVFRRCPFFRPAIRPAGWLAGWIAERLGRCTEIATILLSCVLVVL